MNRPPSLLELHVDELRPMTEEETRMFVGVCTAPQADRDPIGATDPAMTGKDELSFALREALVARVRKAGLEITSAAVAFVAILSDSPGDIVLFAYTCVELARRQRLRLVRLEHLVAPGAFGFGVPTKRGAARIWSAQKHFDGAVDNWLDTDAAWSLEAIA